MDTINEFPGYYYHRDCKEGRVFQDRSELLLAGDGWGDTPAKLVESGININEDASNELAMKEDDGTGRDVVNALSKAFPPDPDSVEGRHGNIKGEALPGSTIVSDAEGGLEYKNPESDEDETGDNKVIASPGESVYVDPEKVTDGHTGVTIGYIREDLESMKKPDLIGIAAGLGIGGNLKNARTSTLVNKILSAEAQEG